MKNCPGIFVRQRHTDQKLMGLLKERYAELRKELLQCCCNLAQMKNGGHGRTPCERRFGEPFEGPVSPFGAMVEYHPISSGDQPRPHQLSKKVLLGIFLGHVLIARNLERTHCDCGH